MNHRRTRIALTTAALGPALILAVAAPAAADHVHFRVLGNGQCVLLAPDGGEQQVQLPHAEGPENRRHPLHVNVHLGQAGNVGQTVNGHSVYVAYLADGTLTGPAHTICGDQFINR
jgi:hypothetical protein